MTSDVEKPCPRPLSPSLHQTTKPFRFKRKRSLSPTRHTTASPTRSPTPHRHHHRHRRHHHHSHHRPHTPLENSDNKDDPIILNPDVAFRESLFDALADDEGAAFWEGVYGQPIHTYSPYYPRNPDNKPSDSEKPQLERMSDEEYIQYVRSKMWEKSHGYIIEERRRREEERKRRKEREEEGRRWQQGVEEALRRGEERRQRRTKEHRWKGVWEWYTHSWDKIFSGDEDTTVEEKSEKSMRERIPWPVESGRWKDVGKEEVERFFKYAPQAAPGLERMELGDLLKRERVRWHPDKMQQRARGGGIDEGTTRLVTAVFQVVDRLWSETKNNT